MSDLETLIATTKNAIGGIISKPKMTDKLLSKPPFRFLHDTITAVIKTTGFGEGLYSDQELDCASISDKASKLKYLEKIFLLVAICKGAPLEVKSTRVVSGLEPENTNSFLIALAEVANDPRYDSDQAVSRALAEEEPGSSPPPMRSSAPPPADAKGDFDGFSDAKGAGAGSKSSSSSDEPIDDRHADAKGSGGSKGPSVDSKLMPGVMQDVDAQVMQERGKSRGGTRGGKPNQSTTDASLGGMMASNYDAEIEKCDGSVQMTQSSLGELITKPKLSDKLLNKPPFRFLFDIIKEVINQTGFCNNLYSPEELEIANITEKTQKLAFLDKIIKVVGIHLNTLVEVKSAKVIAGLDPQNTNNFLQLLALAAKNIPDSRGAVQRVLEDAGEGALAPNNPPPREAPMQEEKSGRQSARGERGDRGGDRDDGRGREQPEKLAINQQSYAAEAKGDSHSISPTNANRQTVEDNDDAETNAGGDGGDVKKPVRPTTARRRPPKVKDGAQEVQAKDSFTGGGNQAKKASGIIIDGADDDDDDEIPEEDTKPTRLADDMKADSKYGSQGSPDGNDGGQQSKLVKDIMSRQAEQAAAGGAGMNPNANRNGGGSPADESKGMAVANESGNAGTGGIRLGRLRKTGVDKQGKAGADGGSGGSSSSEYDLDKMRASIQTLVQHTGPLGTCMDYIQEDVSMMTMELHRWEEECRKYEIEYEDSKKSTKEIIMPLKLQLKDIEDEIKAVISKISSAKATNAKNDDQIHQQLKLIADLT